MREWTECGSTGEDGQKLAPQRNELRSMMCREGEDEPVVYVLENEDRHLEGEACKVVVLEATTEDLARVRVMKIEPQDSLEARCYWACLVMSEENVSLCAKDVLIRMLAQSLIACVFKDAGMRLDDLDALLDERGGQRDSGLRAGKEAQVHERDDHEDAASEKHPQIVKVDPEGDEDDALEDEGAVHHRLRAPQQRPHPQHRARDSQSGGKK